MACTTWPRSARSTSTSPSGRWRTRPGGRRGRPHARSAPRTWPGRRRSAPASRGWTSAPGNGSRSCPRSLSRVNDMRTTDRRQAWRPRSPPRGRPRTAGTAHGSGPRTPTPASAATSPARRTGRSGPGPRSRRCGTPGSASRSSPSCPITASSSTPCPAPGNPSRCCRSHRRRPTPNGCWSSAPNSPTSSPRSSTGSAAGTARWAASPPTTPTSGSGTRRCRCCSSAGSGSSTAPSPPPPSANGSAGRSTGPTVTDAAGQPLRFTPHDFRRMFITDAVLHGMPPHIAQLVAGHRDINTTMGYKAVYPDEVINGHRAFIARRRALRPSAEYRVPTEQEWEEFLGHFEHRKLSLGTCGRSYATPCIHEHACLRCPLLRPDPAQRARLVEIRDNLHARIAEARQQGWLGEVDGLQISLTGAREKLAQLDQIATNNDQHPPRDAHLPADRRTLSPTSRSLIGTAGSDSDERSSASAENKHTFGYHPLLAYLDNTGEFLAAALRPGNAGSATPPPTTSPCSTPRSPRSPTTIVTGIRSWSARTAPAAPRRSSPTSAALREHGGELRVLGRLDHHRDASRPRSRDPGTVLGGRARCRRRTPRRRGAGRDHRRPARPSPGRLPGRDAGDRAPRTPAPRRAARRVRGARRLALHRVRHRHPRSGSSRYLDARHRAHARVEDRIRCAKDTGLDHFPSRSFAINQAWLTVVMLAVDLHRLDPAPAPATAHLAKAEPKTLRYRLLHVAARLTRGQRRLLAAHPTHLALGARVGGGVRPALRAARTYRLTIQPDTTSAGATGRTARRRPRHAHPTGTTPRRSRQPSQDQPHAP